MRKFWYFIVLNLCIYSLYGQIEPMPIESPVTATIVNDTTIKTTEEPVRMEKLDSSAILTSEYLKTFYARNVNGFTKMKRTGITMGLIGGGLFVAGTVMAASADWQSNSNSSGITTGDPAGIFGIVFITVGVPLIITGIVLGSIGSSKVMFYKNKLESISLHMNLSPDQSGLKLVYNF